MKICKVCNVEKPYNMFYKRKTSADRYAYRCKVCSNQLVFKWKKEIIGKLKKAFLMVAGGAVQKYGPDLEGHQQLLMAAADILIEIYMAESTILRTEKLAKKQGEAKVQEQIAMAKLYLYKAVDVVTQKGKESIISFAEGDEQRMMLMGLRRFTKYTNMPNIVGLRETITTKLVAENGYCF